MDIGFDACGIRLVFRCARGNRRLEDVGKDEAMAIFEQLFSEKLTDYN